VKRPPATQLAVLLAVLLAAAAVACSPEASRTRGGGPGADVGNYSPGLPQPSTAPPLPGG
jgi:hypothetical protein